MATSTRTTESATARHQVPDELEESFFALRACARLLTELNPPAFGADFPTVQEFATRFKYLTARMSELVEQLGTESASRAWVASDNNSPADTIVSFIARLSESLKRTLH
jgi:glutathione S-transferase